MIGPLGEGGFAKVFKAKFHGKDVAMKYIPLDKVKNGYQYRKGSYGLHEYINQEQVCSRSIKEVKMKLNSTKVESE